jgi:hypothetical protein
MSFRTEFLDKLYVKELSFESIVPLRSAPSGQWQSYTPVISAATPPVPPVNPLVKNEVRFCVIGKLMFVRYTYSNGSAFFGTAGSGIYEVSLPPGYLARQINDSEAVGDAYGDDGSTDLTGVVTLETQTSVAVRFGSANPWGSSTLPFSEATTVTFSATIELE